MHAGQDAPVILEGIRSEQSQITAGFSLVVQHMLAIMHEDDRLMRYALDIGHNEQLQVISDPDNVLGQCIGNGIWTSAHELVYFLRVNHPSALKDRRVLELGAGLGLVGQAAALSGAQVILSDLTEVRQLLQMNVEANEEALQRCPDHPFGPAKLQPDLILGSDITYDPDQFLPLLQTITAYAVAAQNLKVILAMPDRQESADFLDTASQHGFNWRSLRQIQKPDLLTPVSIYQLILGPNPSQAILQISLGSCSCPADTSRAGGPDLGAASAQTETGQSHPHDMPLSTPVLPPLPNPNPAFPQSGPCTSPPLSPGQPPPSGKMSSQPQSPLPFPPQSPSPMPLPNCTPGSGTTESLQRLSQPCSGHADASPQSEICTHRPVAGRLSSRESTSPQTLLVLDFDWSMIEENSDTFVVHELGGWDTFQRLKAQGLPWTDLMDASMVAVHEEQGCTAEDIKAACAKVPMHPRMKQVLQEASASGGTHIAIVSDANTVFIDYILQAQGIQVRAGHIAIASDANTVFINYILQAQGVQECFHQVITNPAKFVEGALRISPYHVDPHGCAACPPNLCKGLVTEKLLLEHNYHQLIYLGDGRGDHCPCTRTGPNDHILARQQYPDGSTCSLLKLLTEHAIAVKDCRLCLSQSETFMGNASNASGWSDQEPKQCRAAVGNLRGSQTMSHAPRKQQSEAADVDAARYQDTHAADEECPELRQRSESPAPPVSADAIRDSQLQRQHASVYMWNEAADAANLMHQLLQQQVRTEGNDKGRAS